MRLLFILFLLLSFSAFSDNPQIALIFDDLGNSLEEFKDIYSLKIPLTVAILPEQSFSENLAYLADRLGFSVLLHLPLEPKRKNKSFLKNKDKFIGRHLSWRKTKKLLNYYLNLRYVKRVCIGLNNHMGSKASCDPQLMRIVLEEVKKHNKIFIDSHTTENSCICKVASFLNLTCFESLGFLDAETKKGVIKRLHFFIKEAEKRGKIIIIAHPHKTVIEALKEEIPKVKKKVEFVTVKQFIEE